jgi:hypothetical protein
MPASALAEKGFGRLIDGSLPLVFPAGESNGPESRGNARYPISRNFLCEQKRPPFSQPTPFGVNMTGPSFGIRGGRLYMSTPSFGRFFIPSFLSVGTSTMRDAFVAHFVHVVDLAPNHVGCARSLSVDATLLCTLRLGRVCTRNSTDGHSEGLSRIAVNATRPSRKPAAAFPLQTSFTTCA